MADQNVNEGKTQQNKNLAVANENSNLESTTGTTMSPPAYNIAADDLPLPGQEKEESGRPDKGYASPPPPKTNLKNQELIAGPKKKKKSSSFKAKSYDPSLKEDFLIDLVKSDGKIQRK